MSSRVRLGVLSTGQDPGPAHDASSIGPRLDRLPTTRAIWTIIGILSLAFFFEIFELLLTGYVAPALIRSGVLTMTTKGLFGATGVAAFIAALFAGLTIGTASAGFLADRFGRRQVLLGALAAFGLASIVMALQTTATGLNAWRFLAGLGLGAELITLNTYISELMPKSMRGRAFAFSQTIGFSAVPVVAVLAWALSDKAPLGIEGWRWIAAIGGLGALLAVGALARLPESPRWLASRGRLAEADRIVTELEAKAERQAGRPLSPPGPGEPVVRGGRFADIWRPPYGRRAVMMMLFNIVQTIGFYGFVNWAPSLLVQQGIGLTKSLLYSMIIAFAAPVGPLFGTLFGDRFERKHLVMASAAIVAVCGLVFASSTSAVLLILMGLTITVCQNTLSFAYHAYQTEIFPTAIRAKASGFVYAWSRLSAMFTAFVIAFVLKVTGVLGVFVFIAAAMVAVVLIIGLMGPRTRGLSLEEISRAETGATR